MEGATLKRSAYRNIYSHSSALTSGPLGPTYIILMALLGISLFDLNAFTVRYGYVFVVNITSYISSFIISRNYRYYIHSDVFNKLSTENYTI